MRSTVAVTLKSSKSKVTSAEKRQFHPGEPRRCPWIRDRGIILARKIWAGNLHLKDLGALMISEAGVY